MKQTKFRVWDKKQNRWATPFEVAIMLDGCISSSIEGVEDGPEYFELSPFTGVKDAKGNDIYEGDILQLKNGACWTVGFSNGSYDAFGNALSAYADASGHLIGVKIEVIGNKYEHPEKEV